MCQCINKLLLFIINSVFLLLGIAIVSVSLWVILSHDTLFKLIQLAIKDSNVNDSKMLENYMESTSMLMVAAWILLAFGVVSLIIGFCGCAGTTCESVPLLVIYCITLAIIVIAEIAAVITAIAFTSQLGDNLKPRLKKLEEQRFLPWNLAVDETNSADGMFTAAVNYAQVTLQCCGIVSKDDITGPMTKWSNSTKNFNGKNLTVPVTCCQMKSNKNQLLSKQDWKNIEEYLENRSCPVNGTDGVIKEPCYDKLMSTFGTYTRPLIAVGVLVVLCEIICFIMAFSMIQKIRREDQEI